jgi:hypothetical protein
VEIDEQYKMKLRDFDCWGNLSEDDLRYNDLRYHNTSEVSSQFFEEVQESLRRKRYIGNATQDVRALLLRCCGRPDLRCSRIISDS